jgi:hypothetical protein
MTVHRIRLRGPWQIERPKADGRNATETPPDAPQTVRLPAEWQRVFAQCRGPVRLNRRFHRPTNLRPHDEVCIVLPEFPRPSNVRLNGQPATESQGAEAGSARRYAITPFLKAANVLSIEFDIPAECENAPPTGLWGEISLEIRARQE